MNKLRLTEVRWVNPRRSDECDVQMLAGRPSLVVGVLVVSRQ